MRKSDMPQIRIRLQPELLDWVKTMAAQNYRSLNAEVAACLDQVRLRSEQNAVPGMGGAQTAGVASQA